MVAGGRDATSASSRTTVSAFAGDPTAETRGGTQVTAEIPAVPTAKSYGVLLPDGSVWYPGSKRKLPAPLALRVVVWSLAFLVALGLVALVIEHAQPDWVNPLRRMAPSATAGVPGSGGSGSTTGTTSQVPATMSVTSTSANGTSYSVPTDPKIPYVITIKTAQRCYVVAVGEPFGQQLLNATIPADSSHSIYVTGSASLHVAAGGASLTVTVSGGRVVGTIPLLKDFPYPYNYTFSPATS